MSLFLRQLRVPRKTPTETLMPMNYRSRRYALLNRPIEVKGHTRRVLKFLRPRNTDRVLEIGCGRGFLTSEVQRLAPETTGIDLNPHAIANAVTRKLFQMDAQQLRFPNAEFDKIYSFHAIEHIPDLRRAFSEMDRVLRPGGRILLVYPAEPIRGLYVVPTAMLLFGNPLRARDLHLHRLTPRALRPYLTGTSLHIVKTRLHFLLTPQFITVLRKGAPIPLETVRRRARRRRAAVAATVV